jgi:hypothetical protein
MDGVALSLTLLERSLTDTLFAEEPDCESDNCVTGFISHYIRGSVLSELPIDYGEDKWTDCRNAVDDFRRERAIDDEIRRVDSRCMFWKRAR